MASVYTTGSWRPFEGQEEEFLREWQGFMEWAASLAGAGRGVLARDLRDPGRYVSFMVWDDIESVRAWKRSEEFKPRMSRVQAHVDKFAPTEIEVVATVEPTSG
jgi:heme-degrading monooxygenase HmoA